MSVGWESHGEDLGGWKGSLVDKREGLWEKENDLSRREDVALLLVTGVRRQRSMRSSSPYSSASIQHDGIERSCANDPHALECKCSIPH